MSRPGYPAGSFYFSHHPMHSESTVARMTLLALLCAVALGCGGTEKGKNKDLDRPKTESTK